MNQILLTRAYSSGTIATVQKSAKLIRNEFLDYFKNDLGHTFIKSSPVVSVNDHTVAFVNAGMNQFKGVFLDYYDPPTTKVTNSQKCIRITGKHNDLEIVGNDSYHHTFFEMLGNWSFGNYFKEEACRYAWNLLTKCYGINEEFLYVTYFGGDEKLELAPDLECKDIWLSIGVKKDKVLPFGLEENFWEMGISGPCGPSTEIHVDHTKRLKNQSMLVNKGCSDLTELWNIVFIQYERLPNGTIVPLSKHHVDTGMGFERLVALLQGKQSNYDTDLFQPLFKTIQKFTKVPEYKGTFSNTDELDNGYRMLADHSRMITVALADGAIPEQNNKLRRIIRKSIDVSEKVFKKPEVLLELSYAVAENLGDVYPELQNNLKKVQKIINFEIELYENLQRASSKQWKYITETYPQLKSVTKWMSPGLLTGYLYLQKNTDNKTLSKNVAFKLYDTHGLNVKTITELAQIESLHFDEAGFEEELNNQRNQSRVGLIKRDIALIQESLKILEKNNVPKTDDSFKYKHVLNEYKHEFLTIECKILALIINDNIVLNIANESTDKDIHSIVNEAIANNPTADKTTIGIILDKTLCYSEKNEQISDRDFICVNSFQLNINNVKKINDYVIHYVTLSASDLEKWINELKIGNSCKISIEPKFRLRMTQNHTAIHLLNASIQQIIEGVYLRNSITSSDTIQCQYNSFGEKLSFHQLVTIEKVINTVITANIPITTKVLNAFELLNENSITLIPGKIYPYKNIRVVEIDHYNLKSKEPCAAIHVSKTGELKRFCICDYTSKGKSNFNLIAAVGSFANSVNLTDQNVQQKILNLQEEVKFGEITHKGLKSAIKNIDNEIRNANKNPLSYVAKTMCLSELMNLNKFTNIKTSKKNTKSM